MDAITNEMFTLAKTARGRAYAPYSNFYVGVCIQTEDDQLFPGCNVENASYGLAQCAEATAIANMVLSGYDKIKNILIIGSGTHLISPCGACRQRIREFADDSTPILLCDEDGLKKTITLGELLPYSFSRTNLGDHQR